MCTRLCLIGACLGFFLAACEQAPSYTVTLEAGAEEVRGAVVPLELPDGLPDGPLYLEGPEDQRLPVQRTGASRGVVLIDRLPAGATWTFTLNAGGEERNPVQQRMQDGIIRLTVGQRPVLHYQAEPKAPPAGVDSIYTRGGYIHPVYTPSGVIVTDDFPHNHLHHHGIWAAWTRTRYDGREPDFWNMGDGTGTVVPVSAEGFADGPVFSGFEARHRYLDLTTGEPVPVLDETWEVRVYNVRPSARPVWLFDLIVTQTMIGDLPLELPEYRYGGVGFRGHGQWDGPDGAVFLTSEGRDRSDGHATRARWCHIGGLVDGAPAGVSIMDHPGNVRAPQPMRIHPTEPFFNYAPSQLGDWAIEPGEPLVLRYRYLVYDGEPDAALIDAYWRGFANPPIVHVSP
ncbi:hypothetical protein AWN76_004030 [Rhodothermaceae bacterium RA]|nr:hypothetical protein AWN76_004030 [Rhodothermaceae bacterium RA]